jgi:NADH-quinone oxidoreductase subunit C
MTILAHLAEQLQAELKDSINGATIANHELTLEVKPAHLLQICQILKNHPTFDFNMLIDVCGVDYLHYGISGWETENTTETGFSRGVVVEGSAVPTDPSTREKSKKHRFAVVYHLLSTNKNHRLRLRVFMPDELPPAVDSVISIWESANWFEREAFDLFGILFKNHPDLRRILTDYGFVGYPFRKDFPLIGKVEARYDAKLKRVVYESVNIQARVLEPKVIRKDHRYQPGIEEVKDGV